MSQAFPRETVLTTLVLMVLSGAAVAPWLVRAQEGVAGAPPVFSSPKKPPPPASAEDSPQDEDATKQGNQIRVISNLVTAPVTVLDSSGEFVYDLQKEDFQVLDNGVPQQIQDFEIELRSLAVVIVVQTNHDVAPLLDQVRPLGPVFSGLLLGPQGQAAVISFDDQVRLAQDFSNDGDRLAATLTGLAPKGDRARLNDALGRGITLLEKRPRTERRVIVAFSVGSDAGSETTDEEVVRRATGTEVTIYGLGFSPLQVLLAKKPEAPPPDPLNTNVTRPLPPGRAPTPTASENVYGAPIPVVDILVATGQMIRSALAFNALEFYAGYTGGVFYGHWKKKTLEEQLSRVASEIHSQYELAYAPDNLQQTGFHRLEVKVRRPRVKVRTRAGYFFEPPNSRTGAPPTRPTSALPTPSDQ